MSEASIDGKDISWTPVLERYFAESAEKADGLSWMHGEAELKYARLRTWIDLPVILGSGAIAFLNAGSSSLFEDAKMASISLGIGSLVVGTINTLGSYFAWAKRAEGHRIAAISYAKQARFLRVEMGLPRPERMSPGDLLKLVKNETDRLAEIAPAIPTDVRATFKARFKSVAIAKPEVANGIHPVSIFISQTSELPPADTVLKLQDVRPSLVLRSASDLSAVSPESSESASASPTDEEQTHS